ncbi:MAG: hypothetical protein IKX97_00130 [Erysipelotrichaceae bacterium]|nr:hypothetical protein [Erysipelotrichaceae bacterium]
MEEKDITVKDIVDRDENNFRKVYDFVRSRRLLIVFLVILVLGGSYGYYRYREYQKKKQMEEMVQQMVEEVMNQTGTDVEQIEQLLGDDMVTLMQNFDIGQLMEMLQNSGELAEELTPEQLQEIVQMFNQIEQIDLSDLFDTGN